VKEKKGRIVRRKGKANSRCCFVGKTAAPGIVGMGDRLSRKTETASAGRSQPMSGKGSVKFGRGGGKIGRPGREKKNGLVH